VAFYRYKRNVLSLHVLDQIGGQFEFLLLLFSVIWSWCIFCLVVVNFFMLFVCLFVLLSFVSFPWFGESIRSHHSDIAI